MKRWQELEISKKEWDRRRREWNNSGAMTPWAWQLWKIDCEGDFKRTPKMIRALTTEIKRFLHSKGLKKVRVMVSN